MKPRPLAFLFLGCAIALAGCSKKTQERAEPGGLRPESAHAGVRPGARDAALKFTASPGWMPESPSSPNRQAQYKLPRAADDSEDAELVVYYFHGGGGTTQANVDRWIGQFTKPDGTPASDTARITHKIIHGIPLTMVDVSGTYANSMRPMPQAGGSKAHFRMLAAIAEAGNGPWFIKLTGPFKTVSKWEPSFESFVDSMEYSRPQAD
jgi:hypothetical protein